MGVLFGTDGIRGIANESLTGELAYKVGRATANVLKQKGKKFILIGKDTRKSGDMLEAALSAGINSVGVDVYHLGIIPTPGIAYLTKQLGAMAGIVISASHNPGEYNGIKIFSSDGFKLPDEVENRIESMIFSEENNIHRPVGKEVGKIFLTEDKVEIYKKYLKNQAKSSFQGLKVAMDCAHGATYKIAPDVFHSLGATVIATNRQPDGMNINRNCGSTNMRIIKTLVQEAKADVGFSFDGDGDRVLAVDNEGNIMDGDHILAACSMVMREEGRLKKDTVVGTVMSNLGFIKFTEQEKLHFVATKVGDRYVLEEMLENDYSLGGEQSGHIIFSDLSTTGDGILTAIQMMNILLKEKKPLSEINRWMVTYPQILVNAVVAEEKKYLYKEDSEILKAIHRLEKDFENRGRVLIRPSGTEPFVRVMIEGKNQKEIERRAKELADFIEKRLR